MNNIIFWYNVKENKIAQQNKTKNQIELFIESNTYKESYFYTSESLIEKNGWVKLKNNESNGYKIALSKISFPNHRIVKNDKLIFIGKKKKTYFFIAYKEMDRVIDNRYPELIRFSAHEVSFTNSGSNELKSYKTILKTMLNKERVYNERV